MAIKITDLVDQQAMQQLTDLMAKFDEIKAKYVQIAGELVAGINVKVTVVGDLEKLDNLVRVQAQNMVQNSQQLTAAVNQQNTVLRNTTNTISRALAEQEKLNRQYREGAQVTSSWKQITDATLGTNQSNISLLVQYDQQLKSVNAAIRSVQKGQEQGNITTQQAKERMAELQAEAITLKIAKQELQKVINNEEKANQAAEGSYKQLSLELERMKMAYKELNDEQKQSDAGAELLANISTLDNHLKDLAADMGEFQRNVGNYAIASQAGVKDTDALAAALNTEAHDAKQAAEQNIILREALEKMKTTTPNATAQIKELSDKIEKNEKVIQANQQASNGLIQTLSGMAGVNLNLGRSFTSMAANAANGGSMLTGLAGQVKALGGAFKALLANPYVLAIMGLVAGVKWFWDYNKGLVEASRQTKYFTGLTGDSMKSVRDHVQAVADTFNKDFTETLKTANSVAKNFGISVDEATDLVAKGFAAGGVNSDQFLSNLERFAPTMQKMGMSAEEMVATMSQIDKAGVNSSRALTAMGKASLQLRTMNASTSNSLKQIGIDATQMNKDIQSGSKSVNDAMSEVAQKLRECGTTSQEAATVMKDLFGARGESAIGEGFIDFLADSNKGMEELLGKEDSFQRLKLQEVEVDKELNDVVASMFDMTGGGFESVTTKCKIWIKQGLIAAIKWIAELVNGFIDWYNESMEVQAIVKYLGWTFKQLWTTVKLAVNLIIDAFKAVGRAISNLGESMSGFGDIIKGVFTLDADLIQQGWNKVTSSVRASFKEVMGDINAWVDETRDNFIDLVNDVQKKDHINFRINVDAISNADTGDGGGGHAPGTGGNGSGGGSSSGKGAGKSAADKSKDLEKQAQDALKALEQLQESEVNLMEEGLQKTLATIRLNYKKKIDAIKGNSETEQQLRINLAKEMNVKLEQAESAWNANRLNIDIQNRLKYVEKGSQEELQLKLVQLEMQRSAEIAEARKTGADVAHINAKFDKDERELREAANKTRIEKMTETAATEQAVRDNNLQKQLSALNAQQAQELAAVGNNEEKIAAIKEKYQIKSAELQEQYAIETANAQLKALKEQLAALNIADEQVDKLLEQIKNGEIENATALLEGSGLAHDDALNLAKSLASAEIDIDKAVTDAKLNNIERVTDASKKASEKRIENAEKWLNAAGEACSNITDLVTTLFDGQISKIEEEEEANQAHHDAEIERIDLMAEKGQITEEEAEIQKRRVEEETAKKEEELAKKKAKLQYKQAVAEKANNISQIGIATALGIMKASPNWVNMALVAAMGAIQLATAIAQPIKAYKRGTDYHPGGLAVVGDGGKREVVESGGKYWVTPKVPTLVNMPEGSKVFPDYLEFIANEPRPNYGDILAALPLPDLSPLLLANNNPKVVVNNDYRALQREIAEGNRLTKAMIKQERRLAAKAKYDRYRAERI